MNMDGWIPCQFTSSLLETAQNIFPLVYGIPTLCVYGTICYLIGRKRTLQHPFFYHFVFLAVVNSLLWILVFIFVRVMGLPVLCSLFYKIQDQQLFWLRPCGYLYLYCISCNYYYFIFMTLIRCFAIFWPIRMEQLMRKHFFLIMIAQVLTPFVMSFENIFYYSYITLADNGAFVVSFKTDFINIQPALVNAVTGLVCLVILITTTILSVLALRRRHIQERQSVEMNIFITSFTFSITSLILASYQIMVYYFRYYRKDEEMGYMIQDYRGIVFDVVTILPAWLMLITNTRVRSEIFRKKRTTDRMGQASMSVASNTSTPRIKKQLRSEISRISESRV